MASASWRIVTTDDRSGLRLVESRRLTGANLLLGSAGAILDVATGPAAPDRSAVVDAWRRELTTLLDAVEWGEARFGHRAHRTGLSFAFAAPIDALYAACDLHEAAWARTVAALGGDVAQAFSGAAVDPPGDARDMAALVDRLRRTIADEADPALMALRTAAAAHDVPLLWDDDEVSLGLGCHARTWPRDALPAPDAVDWPSRRGVPTVLVTGTNGKSTTVRMLAGVFDAHGWTAGSTSTDGIVVGGEQVAAGDWSGPGGARTLLRDERVEAGVLEVARGGLLRRGVPVEDADAAIVTNVADDHLGEYGIHTVDELADVKLLVGVSARRRGTLVLPADDERLVAKAPPGQRIAWISTDPDAPVVAAAVDRGGTCWVLDDDAVVEVGPTGREALFDVATVPATLGGAARHNVANVLGVTALARTLGVPAGTIATALGQFRSGPDDNPGRANLYTVGGATALVDFAHNPHGMTAILDTARRLPGDRLIVLMSQAGDRTDDDIAALARTVWEAGPALVVAADVPAYLRGREPGEVPRLIRTALREAGAADDQITVTPSPPEGVTVALSEARPGDVLCLLVLSEKEKARAVLDTAGATPTTWTGGRGND